CFFLYRSIGPRLAIQAVMETKISKIGRAALVALTAIAGGCAAGADPSQNAGCGGAKCDGVDVSLDGPDLVRCWIERGAGDDTFFRTDTLWCRALQPDGYPLAILPIVANARSTKN